MVSHDWRPFIYGGLASIMAEFGTYPIDTTKTRLQIQGQKIDKKNSELKYKGMIHALARISKEEGTKALYSGISPALLRQATYGTIKIGVYYTAKKKLVKNPNDENMLTNVVCGIFAGVVSSSLANPTDVLKVRMQAKDATLTRMSMLQCFADMYRKEGLGGLWRGVCPTAQRAAIVVGVELPVYDAIKRQLIKSGSCGDTVVNHLMSSFLAGLAGAVASNPIDVVRTRLMSQRRFKPAIVDGIRVQAIYTSSLDCLLQTVKSEGFFALYKGFVPTWVRLGPWNVIFFVTYEQLKKMY